MRNLPSNALYNVFQHVVDSIKASLLLFSQLFILYIRLQTTTMLYFPSQVFSNRIYLPKLG